MADSMERTGVPGLGEHVVARMLGAAVSDVLQGNARMNDIVVAAPGVLSAICDHGDAWLARSDDPRGQSLRLFAYVLNDMIEASDQARGAA
jgi:hypothetical protein